jgi:hypothetical protein
MRPTDMAYKSCVLGCGGYRSWGGGKKDREREGRDSGRASALDVRGQH